MSAEGQQLPEPLQRFDSVVAPLADGLRRLDAVKADYRSRLAAGRVLPNVVESIRVELTYNSNAIEGNTLSLRQTQLVIEGRAPGGEQSMRELYEARNHDLALRMVENWAANRTATSPVTEEDFLQVHARIMADIDVTSAGQFRTERVLIAGTGYVPRGSQKFPFLIPAMLELANRSGIHPVIQAAEVHYNLAAIHSFNDGNGRTSRLMMNYLLLRSGYPHAIIEVSRRSEYLAALDDANAGRIERFAQFVMESLDRSMEKIFGHAGDDAAGKP